MIGILEWTDDLIGQVVKYKDEEIILITDWVDRRSALAWSSELPSDVMRVSMNKWEIIHRQANEKLCSPAMRAWMMGGRVEGLRFHVYQALAASVDDDIPPESVTKELEYAARDVKKLIEEAKQLEQLIERSAPEIPPGI